MSYIICSLEDWDSIFDYYRPNGSSKTWYIKELKKLQIPTMWGEWNIFTEDGEMFREGHLRGAITPNYSDLIRYIPKDEIGDNPHIYIINVFNASFFLLNDEIGFSCISEKYIEDIRNGKSKILLLNLYEGYSGIDNNYDLEIIEEWRLRANFPENSIYYLNGNLISDQIATEKNLRYKVKGVHYFETWNKYDGPLVQFKPIDDKYLFLSYNRTLRYHRVYMMWHLYEKNLINKGSISFYQFDSRTLYKQEVIPDEFFDYLENNLPFEIDKNFDLYYNLASNITPAHYEKTFISLVTESLTDRNTLFFSEKIWKPIMVGHPFLLLGSKHSLKYLKDLGYKTFDKWVDESYDNEDDMVKRGRMVVNELEKFKDYTIEQLNTIREEMKEICEHNQNTFKKLFFEKYGNSDKLIDIEKVMIEIWNDIKPKNKFI